MLSIGHCILSYRSLVQRLSHFNPNPQAFCAFMHSCDFHRLGFCSDSAQSSGVLPRVCDAGFGVTVCDLMQDCFRAGEFYILTSPSTLRKTIKTPSAFSAWSLLLSVTPRPLYLF